MGVGLRGTFFLPSCVLYFESFFVWRTDAMICGLKKVQLQTAAEGLARFLPDGCLLVGQVRGVR